jgi:hypothetical protein
MARMRDTTAERVCACTVCEWMAPERLPLWRPEPPAGKCPDCGGATRWGVAYGADHPSLSAMERARLRWLMGVRFDEPPS